MGGTAEDRASRAALCAIVPLLGVYLGLGLLDDPEPARALLAGSAQIGCAGALAAGIRRHRPTLRTPWVLLAAGQISGAAGGLLYLFAGVNAAGLSVLASVAHSLLVLAAAAVWTRRLRSVGDPMAGIDVGIIAVVSGFLSWAYVMEPVIGRTDLSRATVVVILAFPILELVTIGLTTRLCFGATKATPALLLFVGALVTWSSADGLLLLQLVSGPAPDTGAGAPLRLTALCALAAAGLHPTMAAPTGAARASASATSPRRLVVLGLTVVLPPVVLLVQYASGGPLHAPAVGIACILISLLVMARMTRLVSEQRSLAITDGLTGLHTRRFFDEALNFGAGRAGPSDEDVGLLLVDVDHFKRVNDVHGHPAGDRVLREIAQRLRDATRSGDVVARYGGEEFAILLPRTTHRELSTIAERVRAAVAATPIDTGTELLTVTVSIGLAAVSEGLDTADDLSAAADQRLYAAKAAGRNCVVS